MRLLSFALVLLVQTDLVAQTPEEKRATLKYVVSLQDTTGAFKVEANAKPSLRATSGAIRTFHYLDAKSLGVIFPNRDKSIAFVLNCYDPGTGSFAEPGGKPDVTITSVGILAIAEFGVPETQYAKAVDYLHASATTFEDVRIGAAALDILKKKPDWLDAWIKIADAQLNNDGTAGKADGRARETASVAAMKLRLGFPLANKAKVAEAIIAGQRPDGGWGKAGAKVSDLETTYRVMRALVLMKMKPDLAKTRAFVAKCRNADGGSGVEAGQPSTLSGVYYAAAVGMFLDQLK